MSRLRVAARWSVRVLLVLLVLVVVAVGVAWRAVARSEPVLDGDVPLVGLGAAVSVERDAIGTAVLKARTRLDAARALGFVHAQERFFEMDLTRRSAAGELSALFGPLALERDEGRRLHRLRSRLSARFAQLPAADRELLQAYAEGVNAGLAHLGTRPWQYLLLRAEPARWQPVDSMLVMAEMFWTLQDGSVEAGYGRALLRERAGDAMYAFLEPRGGRWDAALDASASPDIALPGPELMDLRRVPAPRAVAGVSAATSGSPAGHALRDELPVFGSNNWAVAGSRTTHGGAIVADDMHLSLSTPGIWFRAQIAWGQGADEVKAVGVTLPGVPALVAGSNGHVAWGFTNAYGQWFDWMRIPDGVSDARVRRFDEVIEVKGAAPVHQEVTEFDGWPVERRDGHGYALRWIADQGEAYNLRLGDLMSAKDLDGALRIAQESGLPHQNILVADANGRIGWTIAGRLWDQHDAIERLGRFVSVDRPLPAFLAPDAYPRVVDPAAGQLWTANARQLGGEGGGVIGDGGFDLGARAQQIRDRLAERPRHDEASIGAIHLDDEARFMKTWAARIAAATASSPAHAEASRLVAAWNGRADADQAGYALVRRVRFHALDALWTAWTTPLLGDMQADPKRRLDWHRMFEYPGTLAIDRRAPNLLPQPFATWDEFLRAQVDLSVKELTDDGKRPLAKATWGEVNASHVQHPLARAVPALARWLDPVSRPQSGDGNLPHVANPTFGQSERLVVSPGRESLGTMVVAGGQSGHPMSPYYLAGNDTWATGKTSPLLPGPAQHLLTLTP